MHFLKLFCTHEDSYDNTTSIYVDTMAKQGIIENSCCKCSFSVKILTLWCFLIADDPIDGNWGSWSEWSGCSSNCSLSRTRVCDNPVPKYKGRNCTGSDKGLLMID